MLSIHAKAIVDEVVAATLDKFADIELKPNELAISLINLDADEQIAGNYRGDESIYPASVVKIFYLVAAHRWLEDGLLKETEELNRAMKDMIVDSSNDATHYVIDLLTGTTSGPELPEQEMKQWCKKRNAVNEFFASQGFENLNINQKPWGDGPYGRERVFVGAEYTNRNMLTTNATAKLLSGIVTERSVSPERSRLMMSLMQRDYEKQSDDPEDQSTRFFGPGLPPGCRLWSKAGWTSKTRHDAAYIELPNQKRFVLVAFTVDHATETGILPYIASEVAKRLQSN